MRKRGASAIFGKELSTSMIGMMRLLRIFDQQIRIARRKPIAAAKAKLTMISTSVVLIRAHHVFSATFSVKKRHLNTTTGEGTTNSFK